MSWTAVASKDFSDAVRARSLWILSVLFILLVAGVAYALATLSVSLGGGDAGSTSTFILVLQGSGAFFISIAAILVSYKSIAGERESGSIKLLLGLPNTRTDVIAGKVVGRSLTVIAPLLVGFAIAALINVSMYDEVLYADFALFTVLTLVFAFVFTAVGVGLSSAFGSTSRAAAAAIGFWFVNQFWGTFVFALTALVTQEPFGPRPDWALVLQGLSPGAAYGNAAAYFLSGELQDQLQSQMGSLPEWYGLVVLLGWAVLGLGFGYARFQSADL